MVLIKRGKTVLSFLFLGIGLSSAFWSCDPTAKKTNDQVDLQKEAADTSLKSIDEINKRIVEDPNNPNYHYERAYYYGNNGELSNALQDINRALAIDSSVAIFHAYKGDLLYATGRVAQAKSAYEKAAVLDPTAIEVLLKLSEIHLILRDYSASMKTANDVLKIDEQTPKAYYMKGWIYMETGDSAKAASSFQTAIELNPQLYDAYLLLGLMYAKAKDDLAIEYYQSAIEVNAESTEARYNLGFYLQEKGAYEKAIQQYDGILALDSTYVSAHYNKGFIHLVYLDNAREAIAHFNKAIGLKPDYYQAYYNRGLCYENLGDFIRAEREYRTALQLKPDYNLAAEGLSRVVG